MLSGSVFVVRLGQDYLTKFVPVSKLVAMQDDGVEGPPDDGASGLSARVETEWMNEDAAQKQRQGEGRRASEPIVGEAAATEAPPPPLPFEIVHRFAATQRGDAAVHSLVVDDAVDGDGDGLLCAASGDSGVVHVWELPPPGDAAAPAALLDGVHADRIVALKMLALPSPDDEERRVLFSASRDGVAALWDLARPGAPLASWRCVEGEGEGAATLTCADVSDPADGSTNDGLGEAFTDVPTLFMGTSRGYVLGYAVGDLLSAADRDGADAGAPPAPNLRFRAHGTGSGGRAEAVTAMACGGDGTIPTSARLQAGSERGGSESRRRGLGVASSILLTGGEDGTVKQWCVPACLRCTYL